jgi:hypothetical protein
LKFTEECVSIGSLTAKKKKKKKKVLFFKIKGSNSRNEKIIKSEIKLSLPFMAPDLVYKFQFICLWELV